MSEFKKLLFIVNKFSGAGFRSRLEGRMLTACEKNDVECTIEFTNHRGHATELAEQSIGKFDGVVAVGGDGTVNEIAQALVNSKTPLAIIPKGSGNGLARHLGIPMKVEGALNAIFHSQLVPIDTFRLNGRLSVNVSGIGFDGHIANLFGKNKKRGFWGYTKLVVKEYVNFSEFDVKLTKPGKDESFQKNFIIAIANSSQYGNNARVSPSSSVTDQFLHVARIKKIPFHRGFRFAYEMFTRKLHNNNQYQCFPLTEGTFITQNPVPYHIDGEPQGMDTSFSIVTLPASLVMIVPEKRRSPI